MSQVTNICISHITHTSTHTHMHAHTLAALMRVAELSRVRAALAKAAIWKVRGTKAALWRARAPLYTLLRSVLRY